MSTGKVYKQAIRRVFAKKYQNELMAVYWGREDDAIHVITTLRHYVHKIASAVEARFPRSPRQRAVLLQSIERCSKGLSSKLASQGAG